MRTNYGGGMPRYGTLNQEYADIESTRIGCFWIENQMLGDERRFAEARYDLISPPVADELAARDFVTDDTRYVVIADPAIDHVARSLTDTTKVLF